MLHFPSTLANGGSGGIPRRTDSLNATQQKTPSHQIFLTIEQELHDARRVGSHGQEEDLRSALNMVINRVVELSSMLSEAYKNQAELELQLNVAKSNLQLVIANNEMLEEALKSGNGRDVGWRRASGTRSSEQTERPVSLDSPNSTNANESPTDGSNNSRFFKTFFNGRPGTPTQQQVHLTSPSMPSLHSGQEEDTLSAALQAARASAEKARQDAERERQLAIRERKAADKARADAAAAARDKIALEAEIESLSQALFEEANKMVATERMRRAEAEGELAKLRPLADELKKTKTELREEAREARETREELREAQEEKQALRSALRLIEGENVELRSGSRLSMTHSSHSSLSLSHASPERGRMTRSRSSSEVGTKSPVRSPGASPNIPSAAPSPSLASAPSPYIPSSSSREEDEEPITFAPTGLGLRPELEDSDEDARPTPRHGTLAGLPADSPTPPPVEGESDWRSNSPALSPPPTALAPSPDDPWASA
ncbi:hypothetical protein B0H19DRAFT_1366609 [Mycena capillaripes]|nr:hypothetical protein B0H19DRAFT_1366609 [Mycena capillaripes]